MLEALAILAGTLLAFRARLRFGTSCTAFADGDSVCHDVHEPGGIALVALAAALVAIGLTSLAYHALETAHPAPVH